MKTHACFGRISNFTLVVQSIPGSIFAKCTNIFTTYCLFSLTRVKYATLTIKQSCFCCVAVRARVWQVLRSSSIRADRFQS